MSDKQKYFYLVKHILSNHTQYKEFEIIVNHGWYHQVEEAESEVVGPVLTSVKMLYLQKKP